MTLKEGDWQWRSSSFNFSYLICTSAGQSGYRSFLTGTCPFVTVRTAGLLAPVLARHKMWNRDPWVVPVLGWEGWAHGTTAFSPAHPFISKNTDRDRYMEPCPYSCQYPVHHTLSDTWGMLHCVVPGAWFPVSFLGLHTMSDTLGTKCWLVLGACYNVWYPWHKSLAGPWGLRSSLIPGHDTLYDTLWWVIPG